MLTTKKSFILKATLIKLVNLNRLAFISILIIAS